MKVGYELLGKDLPLDCRVYNTITYCLNCDEPIRNERRSYKEYCCLECEEEHRAILKLALED